MVVVVLVLGGLEVVVTVALAVVALVLLLTVRPNSAWLVAGGAAVGLLHGALT